MARTYHGLWESDLERALLRKGVGALEAGRHTCADCGRTPLVVELVRHSERGQTVRRVLRPAA
jgi:hypothetical protein